MRPSTEKVLNSIRAVRLRWAAARGLWNYKQVLVMGLSGSALYLKIRDKLQASSSRGVCCVHCAAPFFLLPIPGVAEIS